MFTWGTIWILKSWPSHVALICSMVLPQNGRTLGRVQFLRVADTAVGIVSGWKGHPKVKPKPCSGFRTKTGPQIYSADRVPP